MPREMVEGESVRQLSVEFKLNVPSIQNRKQRLGLRLLEFMGTRCWWIRHASPSGETALWRREKNKTVGWIALFVCLDHLNPHPLRLASSCDPSGLQEEAGWGERMATFSFSYLLFCGSLLQG